MSGPRTEDVPRLARLLVRLVTPREDRPFLLADLAERHRALRVRRGRGAAWRWYWWQALRGVPGGLALRASGARRPAARAGAAGDVRLALRSLVRRPLYTLGVTGTLALGLGSAAAVAAVAWTVWLAPMPFPDPDRVVRVYELLPPEGSPQLHAGSPDGDVRWRLSPPLVEDLRRHSWRTLEAVAGVSEAVFDWSRDGEVRRVEAALASPGIERILGLRPVAGRLPADDPDRREVVLSHLFWERAFGGDPAVVGTTLSLDGEERHVVGVVRMPDGYPAEADLLAPLRFDESQLRDGFRGARYLDAVARVRPGHTVAEAGAELNAFLGALGETQPQHRRSGAEAVTLGDDLVAPYTDVLSLLLLAGMAFLVLAMVNVAGLVAARRVEGRADRWVRLALGASEGRLLRAALVEGLVVGGSAGVAGLVAAVWLLMPVRALVPGDVPRAAGLAIEPGLGAAVLLGGVLAGGGVALLGHVLARTTRLSGTGPARARGASAPGLAGRRLLVVGQVALTTLLVTGGAVILGRVASLQEVELGFEARGVQSSSIVLSETRHPTDQERLTFWRGLLEGLEARGIPAAVAVNPPMAGSTMPFGLRPDAASDQTFAQYHSVSPGYFDLMGIRVVEGRPPGAGDGAGSAPVVLVDETLARDLFPEGGAVGREILVVAQPRTVVGVVAATRHFGPDAPAPPGVYVPLEQDPWGIGHLLLPADRPDAAAAALQVVGELDPSLAPTPPAPYARHLEEWFAPLRLQLAIVGILALVGTALAALGLYALVAYHVSSRRREIGIRMALGAPGRSVFRSVIVQGLGLAAVGATVGLAAWYALLPLTGELLDGASPGGPALVGAVLALVGGVALVATLVPAWRSTTVDPVTTLADE